MHPGLFYFEDGARFLWKLGNDGISLIQFRQSLAHDLP